MTCIQQRFSFRLWPSSAIVSLHTRPSCLSILLQGYNLVTGKHVLLLPCASIIGIECMLTAGGNIHLTESQHSLLDCAPRCLSHTVQQHTQSRAGTLHVGNILHFHAVATSNRQRRRCGAGHCFARRAAVMSIAWGRLDSRQKASEHQVHLQVCAERTASICLQLIEAEQGWAKLPCDLLQQVLTLLTTEEQWTVRQVSKDWASIARQIACFEVMTKAARADVLTKAKLLCKRQHVQHIPNARFILEVQPLQLKDLLDLAQQLKTEVEY